MQGVSLTDGDVQHIELPLGNHGTWLSRDDRFDRVTRTALRLLDRGESLVCLVEEGAHWLLSAQGLDAAEAATAVPMCSQAVIQGKVLMVPDMRVDPRFWDNALVTGPPFLRSYVGVPLSPERGSQAGAICVMDPDVAAFRYHDIEVLEDMAHMAASEMRVTALSQARKRLEECLARLEPHLRLDPVTGCWNVRAFRDLVARAVHRAAQEQSTLALCYVRVRNFESRNTAGMPVRAEVVRRLLGQVLGSRLPGQGALASLGGADFCALVPGAHALDVEAHLAAFTYQQLSLAAPGLRVDLDLQLQFGLALLHEMPTGTSATEIWATALAKLDA
ncbi:MAG: GAF domain-containing protein [Ramlibacter sp.]|nr:GAF domain-containing protein [Ramlibacter sp.]